MSFSHSESARLWASLINATLRGLGLVLRFVLMVYLARYASFETIGAYGLVYAAASLTPAVLSFGLHYRLNRRIIDAPQLEVGHRLRDRLLLHLLVFAVLAGLGGAVVGVTDFVPSGLAEVLGRTAVACLGELLLNEIHLNLISNRRPVLANVVYFCRSVFWVLPFIAVSFFHPAMRGLGGIVSWWLGGQLLALAVFGYGVRHWPWREILRRPIDFPWLLEKPKTSALIYVSDIGTNTSMFADRFVMSAFLSVHDIGIYTFFWNLANGLQQLVFTAVVQIAFPHLVTAARSLETGALRRRLRAEMARTFVTALLFGGLVYAMAPVLDVLVGRHALVSHEGLFAALLGTALIRGLGDMAQYGLYAKGKDRHFALINICAALSSTGFSAAGLALGGLAGIGPALILSSTTVLLLRVHALRQDLL